MLYTMRVYINERAEIPKKLKKKKEKFDVKIN